MANQSKKRARPNWLTATLGTVLGAAVVAGGMFSIAYAISTSTPMEIDGNANDNLGGGSDWESELPLNGPGEVFIQDQVPPLGTETFFHGGGSKDDNQPNKWGVLSGSSTNPNKNNITNAYAKAINVQYPASDLAGHPAVPHDHLIIYFGADRFDNEGDAALGFWFFENEVAQSGNGFTGTHTNKDVLVQVDYVNGGARAEIQVFRWQADGTGTHGSPKVLKEIAFGAADNVTVCNAASAGTPANVACATTNDAEIDEFWPFVPMDPSPADKMPARSFFEGAVDITALIGPACFSSFLAETRSSHSETAQLKDFALGAFDLCSIKMVDKACDAVPNVSPSYDLSTDTFTTRHTITIQNSGIGTVYDVQIRDAVSAASSCDIVEINNQAVTNIPLPIPDNNPNTDDAWVEVAASLAGGAQMTVELLCLSEINPFVNQASVRASATDGGTPISADADDTVTESGADVVACTFDADPLLDVTKTCDRVVLDPETFAPQVCVDITITNPVASQQVIDIDTFSNTEFDQDGVDGPLVPDAHDIKAAFVAANGGSASLPPNGTPVAFEVCYEPDAPNGFETDPGKVMYTDTIRAAGTGRLGNADIEDTASATCKLCPTCPTCPPPGS